MIFAIRKITDFITRNSNLCDIYEIDRVRYGVEVAVKESVKFTFLLVLSILLHQLPEFIIITTLIVGLRRQVGGEHCKSFATCVLKTVTVYLVIFLLSSNLSLERLSIQIGISFLAILILSRVKYKTKLTKEGDKHQNSKIRIKILTIYFMAILITNYLGDYRYINSALITSLYIIYEYIKKEFGGIVMNFSKVKRIFSNQLMAVALVISAASLSVVSEIWWEEIDLPLDVKEKQ